MKQSIKCALRLHNYDVFKEEDVINVRKEIVAKVIISRCKHCGKIKHNTIPVVERY